MTKPKYTIDYSNPKECTITDLQTFIAAWTGESTSEESRPKLISILRHLDRDATFRFFDLAPELRLLVYEALLVWNTASRDGKAYCFPRILVSCRKAYEEAEGILYGANVSTIRLVAKTAAGRGRYWPYGVCLHAVNPQLRKRAFAYDKSSFPGYLRRFERMHITLIDRISRTRPSHVQSEAVELMNRTLDHLVNVLFDGKILRSISMSIEGTSELPDGPTLIQALWPLAKLKMAHDQLELTDLPTPVHAGLEKQIEQWPFSRACNTRARTARVVSKYHACKLLAYEVKLPVPETSRLYDLPRTVSTAARWCYGEFWDWEREADLIRASDVIEEAFQKPEAEIHQAAIIRKAQKSELDKDIMERLRVLQLGD